MLIEVKVPALPESVTDATLLTWRKAAGEAVHKDENLVDLETDKVVLEIPASRDGVLAEIKQPSGTVVRAGAVIAVIDTEAVASVAPAAVAAPAIASAPAAVADEPRAATPRKAAAKTMRVGPAARKLAREQNVDLQQVVSDSGTVSKADVLAQAAVAAAPVSGEMPPPPVRVESRPEQRVAMTRLRARIAERLKQAQETAAILTTFNEVNMQPVMDLRARYQERFVKEHGVKLGFMAFFTKAVVEALKKFPLVNASIDGEDIVYHGYFDIGIAVGSPRGLVVPILRNADRMSFADIEKTVADFGGRARDGKLALDELTGGTFTISNGGIFGSLLSTPILNPPQSAILGMHKIQERPVAENGTVVIRPMMYLALSYDHRIIDGHDAVLFLVAIKDALEDPARILLQV